MAAGTRVRGGSYTDSDIITLYLKYREANIGAFIREVGDFVAHPERDRGVTLEASRYVYAQIAFFQKYQSNKGVAFEANANCDWWLKDYFYLKIKNMPEKIVRKKLKITRKEALDSVESWFGSKKSFSNRIDCTNYELLNGMLRLFSSVIDVRSPFSLFEIKRQIGAIFSRENIPISEFERFLAGTCVVLAGRSGRIGPGVTATLHLTVKPDLSKVGDSYKHGIDGQLCVNISTRTDDKSLGIVDVGTTFIETNVDSQHYVSRRLIEKDTHGFPRLHLERDLSFETTRNPNIEPLAD